LSEHALATVTVEVERRASAPIGAQREPHHWSGYASTVASARPRSSSGLRK
jgi:hypothetical protein